MTKKPRKLTQTIASSLPSSAGLNRRKEWRLELPLPVIVEGNLPQGKKFKEKTTLENISSTGAYFGLDSGITIDSSLNLLIELPHKLTEGKKLKLCLRGTPVRLEKLNIKNKKQGVALRFNEEFKDEEIHILLKEE